jgi:hypothetical protein
MRALSNLFPSDSSPLCLPGSFLSGAGSCVACEPGTFTDTGRAEACRHAPPDTPEHETRMHQPYTLHPQPYSLNPTPYTQHPTPDTLHPTPCTLHPKL